MAPQITPQTRLKVSLKMSISKLRFIQEKKSALAKQQRRQLADLLSKGKEQSARIRVENIIRDDIYIELCEILELYCELLLARISLIDATKDCDPGLEEAVKTILFASPHADVKELLAVRDILAHRYGNDFYQAALNNEDSIVPKKVVDRVKVKPPSEELVSLYLKEIARAYEVPFSELSDDEEDYLDQFQQEAEEMSSDDDDDQYQGNQKVAKSKTPPIQLLEKKLEDDPAAKLPDLTTSSNPPIKVRSPSRSVEDQHPQVKVPKDMKKMVTSSSTRKKSNSETADLEALRQRFAALKGLK